MDTSSVRKIVRVECLFLRLQVTLTYCTGSNVLSFPTLILRLSPSDRVQTRELVFRQDTTETTRLEKT